MSLPPGPPIPTIFQTVAWAMDPPGYLARLYRRYGDIFLMRNVLSGDEIVVSRPEAIRAVVTGDMDTYSAGEANVFLEPIVGRFSLLMLDGKEHTRHRKLMLGAFVGERMQAYTGAMEEAALAEIRTWKTGETISLARAMQRVTLDVILRVVLGLTGGPETERMREQLVRMIDIAQGPLAAFWLIPGLRKSFLGISPYDRITAEVRRTDELIYAFLSRRRKESRREDVLQMLLDATDENGKGLSDSEVRDELVTMLLAGHETTATSLAWAFEEILRCEGEQGRLREEVQRVIGSQEITAALIQSLERLDSALKEALRLHPVTLGVGRYSKKPVELEGYVIPPGKLVAAYMTITHRRPDIYPNPETFVPDRFIGVKIDPYAWLPFGGGARRCIGMSFAMHEMKVVAAAMLPRVELSLIDKGPVRAELRSFLQGPRGGTKVRVGRPGDVASASVI